MVWGLAWDPDGSRLLSGSFGGPQDQTILVWEGPRPVGPAAETALTFPARLNRLAFSPTGHSAVAAGFDGSLYVWDGDAGGAPTAVPAHDGEMVFGLAFSPDGARYATAAWDRSVRVFDAASHRQLHRLGLDWNGQAVAFSPDGRILAAAEWNGQVSLWDPHTGAKDRDLVGQLDLGYPATSLAFSPDGKWLAAGSADRTATVWRCDGWKKAATLKGHRGSVACVEFDPTSQRLVTGSWDGEVWVWDLQGTVLRRLPGHANRVNDLAFSSDGRWLATGSEDKRVRLFDWTRPEAPPTTFEHRGPVWGVAFHPDGRHLASAGWDKAVRYWALPDRSR
jgi:WD40 repeat protein